jgi:hypothetical protein
MSLVAPLSPFHAFDSKSDAEPATLHRNAAAAGLATQFRHAALAFR